MIWFNLYQKEERGNEIEMDVRSKKELEDLLAGKIRTISRNAVVSTSITVMKDIALFTEMGFKTFRMSISWPRIFQMVTRQSQMKKG